MIRRARCTWSVIAPRLSGTTKKRDGVDPARRFSGSFVLRLRVCRVAAVVFVLAMRARCTATALFMLAMRARCTTAVLLVLPLRARRVAAMTLPPVP
jgi:hypothetical protein